jgi:hypothetical protein
VRDSAAGRLADAEAEAEGDNAPTLGATTAINTEASLVKRPDPPPLLRPPPLLTDGEE